MIAIDTNVLLRYLLWDNKTQAAKADKLINGPAPVLITDVVLADALIVNKAKFYTMEKGEALNGVYAFDLAARIIPGIAAP